MEKTQVWNAAGNQPPGCDLLERIAQASDPEAQMWKGSGIPWLKHPDYVHAYLTRVLAEHDVLMSRIPFVEDVQSAWGLLLHCAGERAKHTLRVIRQEMVLTFAEATTRDCGHVCATF